MRVILQRLSINKNTREGLRTPNYSSAKTEKSCSQMHNQFKITNQNKMSPQRTFSSGNKSATPSNRKLRAFINEPDDRKRMSLLTDLLSDIQSDNNNEHVQYNQEKNDPIEALFQKTIMDNNGQRYKSKK